MDSRFGVTPLGIALCLMVSSACAQDGTLLVVNRHSKAGSVSFFDLETDFTNFFALVLETDFKVFLALALGFFFAVTAITLPPQLI